MGKLKLDMEALNVEAFETAAVAPMRRGMSYEYEEGCSGKAIGSGFDFCALGAG